MDADRLHDLLEAHLEKHLTPEQSEELHAELRRSPESRRRYWEFVQLHVAIEESLSEIRGRDLGLLDRSQIIPSESLPKKSRSRTTLRYTLVAGLLLLLGIGSIFFLTTLPRTEPTPIATMEAISGDVQVTDANGKARIVQVGSPLFPGQRVQVGDEESQVELLLGDGTQVTLSSGSWLRLPDQTLAKPLCLEQGAMQVQTAAGIAPLVVTTDHGRITASETRFRLYRETTGSRVELETGHVRFENPTQERSIDLSEGSFLMATEEPASMVPQPLPMGHCTLKKTFLRTGDGIRFSPDGTRLLTSHTSRGNRLWSLPDGKLLHESKSLGQWSYGVGFASEDKLVLLGNQGKAGLWNLTENQITPTILRSKEVRCGAVSADGRWLVQGVPGEISLWHVDPLEETIGLHRTFMMRDKMKPWAVAVTGDGSQVAFAVWDGTISVRNVSDDRELDRYKLAPTPTLLALSDARNQLATFVAKRGLELIDRTSQKRTILWPGEAMKVSCLRFDPQGEILFAGLEDGTVRAWSTRDARPLLVLETGNRRISRIDLTADLNLLATVGDGDVVKVWQCQLPNAGVN